MKGRKRHIVVDTLGLPLAVAVHPANIQDRDGARLALAQLLDRFPRLRVIWADGAYGGKLVEWARTAGGWTLARLSAFSSGVGEGIHKSMVQSRR